MLKVTMPPKTPATMPEIERAIMLLGSRSKMELTTKTRKELELLVGRYPATMMQAVSWKMGLTQLRKERRTAISSSS